MVKDIGIKIREFQPYLHEIRLCFVRMELTWLKPESTIDVTIHIRYNYMPE